MDLNLLPQDLRFKEEKEKNKRQPYNFKVELSQPSKTPVPMASQTKPNRLTWWQNLFGKPKINYNSASLTEPPKDKLNNQINSGDWLKSQNIKPSPAMTTYQEVNKSGFWSSLLGRPISPIVYDQVDKSAIQAAEIVTPKINPVLAPIKHQSQEIKSQSDSWGALLKNLFAFNSSKKIDLNFASEESNLPVTKDLKQQSQPPVIIKAKETKTSPEKVKTNKKSAYHLAPKIEKGNNVNVNFIPGELAPSNNLIFGEIRFLIISILIPIFIVSACYIVLLFLQDQANKQMKIKQTELSVLEKSIGNFLIKEKQHNIFSSRLLAIKKIFNEKKVWSNFFNYLEKYTLDGVYFTNLSADTSGVLVLPGIADNYSVLAKQLAVFNNADDFLKDFKISNSQLYSEGKAGVVGVSFQLRLNLKDDLLKGIK